MPANPDPDFVDPWKINALAELVDAQIKRGSVQPEHRIYAMLGLRYGVTWKGRDYPRSLSEDVAAALQAARETGATLGLPPDAPVVAQAAFIAVSQNADPSRLLYVLLKEKTRQQVEATRRKLISREAPERLREYRRQNEFKYINLNKARELGYQVDAEATMIHGKPLAWGHPTRPYWIYKVRGYTGDEIDPEYPEDVDGQHTVDSAFIELRKGDRRDPQKVWDIYRRFVRNLEIEIAGQPAQA